MRQLVILLCGLLLYFGLKALEQLEVSAAISISNWSYDLLVLPVVLSAACMVLRLLYFLPKLVLPKGAVWATTGAVALTFELVLPTLSTTYTRDIIDLAMYVAGAVVYLLLREKSPLGVTA